MKYLKKIMGLSVVLILSITLLSACNLKNDSDSLTNKSDTSYTDQGGASYIASGIKKADVVYGGSYDSEYETAAYIVKYNKLPDNFMTKTAARSYGWTGGALNKKIAGKSIGGDKFGNSEGLLPNISGRTYYECDIDTSTSSARGAKRLIYSKGDALNIYYTSDHYSSFELIYGTDKR